MKLNVRIGDVIIVRGESHKVVQISELNINEKLNMQIAPQTIARRLMLNDQSELIFLGC